MISRQDSTANGQTKTTQDSIANRQNNIDLNKLILFAYIMMCLLDKIIWSIDKTVQQMDKTTRLLTS